MIKFLKKKKDHFCTKDQWNDLFLFAKQKSFFNDFSVVHEEVRNSFNCDKFIMCYRNNFLLFIMGEDLNIEFFNTGTEKDFEYIYTQIQKCLPEIKKNKKIISRKIYDAARVYKQYAIADNKLEFDFKFLNFQKNIFSLMLISEIIKGDFQNRSQMQRLVNLTDSDMAFYVRCRKKRNMYYLNRYSHNFYKYMIDFIYNLKKYPVETLYSGKNLLIREYIVKNNKYIQFRLKLKDENILFVIFKVN